VPLPVIADTFRCGLQWVNSAGAAVAANVIHLRRSSATAAQAFAELDNNATSNMWTALSSNNAVRDITVTPLDGVSPSQTFLTNSDGRWASTAGVQGIPQSAAVVKLTTGHRGRRYRGRLFLPYVAESQQADGALSPGTVVAMQDAWNTFLSAIDTDTWAVVIASYGKGPHGTWAPFATDVSLALVETQCGTVRKRMSRLR